MDDDYVAQVMAKEAEENSKKYSLEGLGAYRSQKRDVNAPRANTRFLRHLIKETDSHNTALKRKEEKDARDRMRQLKDQRTQDSDSQRLSPAPGRHERERHHSTRESERRQRDDRHDSHHRSYQRSRRHRSRSASSDRDRSRRHRRRDEGRSRSRDTRRYREHRDRTHRDGDQKDRDHRSRRSRRSRDGRDRSRERERDREPRSRRREDDRDRGRRSSRRPATYRRPTYSDSRSRSPRRDRSSEPHRNRRHHASPSGTQSSKSYRTREQRSQRDEDTRSPRRSANPASCRPTAETQHNKNSSGQQRHEREESDPLEDMIGPLPPQQDGTFDTPVRSRGRGAYKPNSSNIDSHFAPDYDPTVDIQPDEDEASPDQPKRRPVAGLMTKDDDWDMALEALRDRARWKQKGEERLREAGLNESIIERWKDNTVSTGADGEKRPEDVQWSKKGEGREWDRGKVMDDQGHTDVHASW